MSEVKLPTGSLAMGMSLLAVVVAIVALVLAIVLPGPEGAQGIQGPQGVQGIQGLQGPAGENWTLSVERYEWSLSPDESANAFVYLEEGDVLEGCLLADVLTDWNVYICGFAVVDVERFYYSYAGYPIDFRYVAEATGSHWLGVNSDNLVTEDVTLVYWVIQ